MHVRRAGEFDGVCPITLLSVQTAKRSLIALPDEVAASVVRLNSSPAAPARHLGTSTEVKSGKKSGQSAAVVGAEHGALREQMLTVRRGQQSSWDGRPRQTDKKMRSKKAGKSRRNGLKGRSAAPPSVCSAKQRLSLTDFGTPSLFFERKQWRAERARNVCIGCCNAFLARCNVCIRRGNGCFRRL